jgi:hypothetical protein
VALALCTDIAWRWYWPDQGAELLVTHHAAMVLGSHRQRHWRSNERGGQLFAQLDRPDGLRLALATPPHPNDKAGRTWLELDGERCGREIENANSAGLRLIGYWHTHPETVPNLSVADRTSFTRFSTCYSSALPNPIAIIVGLSLQHNGIRAWSMRKPKVVEGLRCPLLMRASDNE